MEIGFSVNRFSLSPLKKNEKRNSYENKEKQCVLFLIYFLLFYLNFLLFCYGWSFVRCMPHTELWRKKLEKSRRLCRLRCCRLVWFVVVSITEGANHFARVCLITELALVRLSVTKVNFIFHSFEEKTTALKTTQKHKPAKRVQNQPLLIWKERANTQHNASTWTRTLTRRRVMIFSYG